MKNPSNLKFFGLNVLIAVLLVLTFLVIVLVRLKKYTDHGHEIEVPQITGLYPADAEYLLAESNLRMEIIDSTFSSKVPLGTIVEQIPVAESHVKTNRAIYVVINANAQKQVVLPELHDVSYRQAENMLHQLGLKVSEILYEPSEYKDLVLDLRMNEISLETGQKVPDGSSITMVVGQGRGSEMMPVPDVVGMRLQEARSALLSQHFTVGQIDYDEQPEEDNRLEYVIYSQRPQPGSVALEGTAVQICLSLDKAKAVTTNTVDDEEDFF